MQIPPAENIFAKGAFCAFYKTSTYGDSFTVVKNKFIAVHIPDVFKIYYDSSIAHKEIISVIKQHYKFGKCTAHRLFGFVRTMNMYAVLKMLGIQNAAKLYTQRVTCRGYFNVFFLNGNFLRNLIEQHIKLFVAVWLHKIVQCPNPKTFKCVVG